MCVILYCEDVTPEAGQAAGMLARVAGAWQGFPTRQLHAFPGACLPCSEAQLCCVRARASSSGGTVGLTSDFVVFRSSVFALHFTEPPISAQLLAFLRVFCMTEGKNSFFLLKL